MQLTMRKNIYVLLLLIAASSCSDKQTVDDKRATDLDEFETYQVDVESKPTPIFELIEEVEVMRLEETDESLLGGIYEIYDTGNEFIFPNRSDKGIYTYSKSGEYLSKFNHLGDGPGEYGFIQSFWVEKDTVFLYDINKRRLLSYSLKGGHLKSWKVPFHATSFYSYRNGFVADLDHIPFQDSLNFNVLFTDKDMEAVGMANPYDLPLNLSIMMTNNKFQPYLNGLIFHQDKSDTVFFIDGTRPSP